MNRGQMTRMPELAAPSPNFRTTPTGGRLDDDVKYNVHEAHIHGGSSVDSVELAAPSPNFRTTPTGGRLDDDVKYNTHQVHIQSGTPRLRRQEPTTRLSPPNDVKGAGEPSGICDIFLIGISYLLVICTMPLSLFFCFKVVQEYERAVIFRLGRLSKGGARGPGLFFILPCTDNYCKCDLRTVSFNVPPQEVLSKDSVTVSVDAVVYYRIQNATIAVSNVANYDSSTQLLAATTLRTVLGTKSLSEILSEREHISHVMQSSLDEATAPWGIKVERVEIKDVRLPQQMQRAMAAEAEAQREARAKVIAAEGEQRASRALKEAADVISDSPGALQLRYLQTLTSIAAEKNSTVVFPLPMELMRGLGMKSE